MLRILCTFVHSYFFTIREAHVANRTTVHIDLTVFETSLLGCVGRLMSDQAVRILVVEDEAVVLHTLQLILKQNGYDVRGARDGAEALTIAANFTPNILLCDINLPDKDGIEISLEVKRAIPECRIVLLSGEITSTELLEVAQQQGHHFEVLAKPTEPQQLLRVLAGHDGSHRDPSGIHRVK